MKFFRIRSKIKMTNEKEFVWNSSINDEEDDILLLINNYTDRNWSVLVLILFIVLAVVGNTFVCVAIIMDRRLQNVTNYFLFSLAIADLLVSTLVMPFSILVEFDEGRWRLGFTMCAVYCYLDVFLCSSSIVHMTCISLDRYLGISHPLKTRNKSNLIVFLKIIVVWLITIIISCPLAVLTFLNPAEIYANDLCQIVNRYYMIYGSTLAFIIPCLIMLITYIRTTQLLKQQSLLCLTNSTGFRRTIKRQRSKSLRQSSIMTAESDEGTLVPPSSRSPSERQRKPTTGSLPSRTKTSISYDKPILQALIGLNNGSEPESNRSEEKSNSPIVHSSNTFKDKFREKTGMLLQKARNSSSTAAELANEQKATRVLGLVFACFFICWTPFFALNFIHAFCGDLCRSIPKTVESTFLWLGYLSSMINPIIYTTFNKKFRKAFLNILTCHCPDDRKRRRSNQSISYSYVNGPTMPGNGMLPGNYNNCNGRTNSLNYDSSLTFD